MIFNKQTRALNSRTGYFKSKNDEELFNSTIYLGILDKPENYIPIKQQEYIKLLLERTVKKDESKQ